ncbi:MAG: hypothetical protein M1832_005799 [Thelocarpon impressellum]|nr:MAG: hypothetical protein M1832_005799 [Thelocarpon impressellum]
MRNVHRGRKPWLAHSVPLEGFESTTSDTRGRRRCTGTACFNQRSCTSERCGCVAQHHPRPDPMGGGSLWVATCRTQLAPRSEESGDATACPCNCTYVSSSCCGSDEGVVHEEPSQKLGRLHPPEGMCCNAQTGELQDGRPGGNDTACREGD